MKILILIIVLTCASITTQAQVNLVYNGSFEQYDTCPNGYDQIRYAIYWDGIDTNYNLFDTSYYHLGNFLPEYINICSSDPSSSSPANRWFYHYPRTGNGMVCSEMYYDFADLPFESYNYFQGRLLTHLDSGQSYCVTFFVTMAKGSGYEINKIGAYLDDGTIDTTHTPALPQFQYIPQILDTNIISDTLNWTKIQGNFIAHGNEKFITIGVFFDTGSDRHINIGGLIGVYLTDDVSVINSNATAYAGNDTTIRPGDTVMLGPAINGDGMPCYWYKLGGIAPIDSGGNMWVHPDSTTSYVVEMDLCGVVTYDTVTVTVKRLSVVNLAIKQLDNVTIYPNPNQGSFTLNFSSGNNEDAKITVTNMLGEKVKELYICANKETEIQLNVPTGVYFLSAVINNTKVVRKIVVE